MLKVELQREVDGRWIGEVPTLRGVLAYSQSEAEARANTMALAWRLIADRIENGEATPEVTRNLFTARAGGHRPRPIASFALCFGPAGW